MKGNGRRKRRSDYDRMDEYDGLDDDFIITTPTTLIPRDINDQEDIVIMRQYQDPGAAYVYQDFIYRP